MWDDLVRGAIGAVVLVDTRRLTDCFAAIDFFEDAPAAVHRGGQLLRRDPTHSIEDVREALAVGGATPVIQTDARSRESTKQTLITLVEHAMRRTQEELTARR